MSYYTAKKSYEESSKPENAVAYTCSVCMMGAEYSDLATYGARCWKCYDTYCKSAPHYEPQPTFTGDAKDWARRILHKEKNGLPVSQIAVKFAKEALRIA